MIRKIVMIVIVAAIFAFQSSALAFTVTSPFGWRIHPISGEWSFHSGVDFAADLGTPIKAYFDGVVIFAEAYGGYGNTVLIRHESDIYTLYGHCQQLYVMPGQKVNAGDVIATVGSTGNSTGPHLHLEYWVDHKYVDPLLIWK